MAKPPRKQGPGTDETADQIRQDIERTRRELGATVEALAHKANVPERMKTTARETREKMTVTAAEVAEQLQAKATVAAGKAKAVSEQARAQLPPPLEHGAEQVVTTVRRRPLQTAAIVVIVLFLLRRIFRGKGE